MFRKSNTVKSILGAVYSSTEAFVSSNVSRRVSIFLFAKETYFCSWIVHIYF